jgi:hypothetical protein
LVLIHFTDCQSFGGLDLMLVNLGLPTEKHLIFEEKNIKIIIDGLFEETCDIFFKLQREQKNTIALLHTDCDIYSSTKTVFNAI